MAKTFSFTTVLRKNMMDKTQPDLYYALAKSNGDTNVNELADRIQRACTVNEADVVCVLRALQLEMIDCFKRGESVKLDDLGTFFVTLRSSGVATEKEVKENLIKGARVRFRPGKVIKDALKTLVYSKYRTEDEKGTTGGSEEGNEPETPGTGGGEEGGGEAPMPGN